MTAPAYVTRDVVAGGLSTRVLEAGSGPPLVLLHGGGAGADSAGNWRACFPVLARDAHVFAIDMVGFGHTDKPDPSGFEYSQATRVTHVASVLDALGLKGVTLVGNSMGGMTSTGVAIERPDLVAKVVLMGSAGIRAPINDDLKAIMNYDFTTAGMLRIVRGLTNPDFRIDDTLVDYRFRLSTEPATRAAYGAIMGWIGRQGGLYYPEDYISRLRQPALVVHGKLDRVVPLASAYRFLELIENSSGYILPHCGHWAMIEHPAPFCRVVTGFAQER